MLLLIKPVCLGYVDGDPPDYPLLRAENPIYQNYNSENSQAVQQIDLILLHIKNKNPWYTSPCFCDLVVRLFKHVLHGAVLEDNPGSRTVSECYSPIIVISQSMRLHHDYFEKEPLDASCFRVQFKNL